MVCITMFGEGIYSVGVPVPPDMGNRLNELILAIAEKEKSFGVSPKLTSIINVKGDFHVTVGVFHPGILETNRKLFAKIVDFLRDHKEVYSQLKINFKGKCIVTGIGFEGHDIGSSNVVWASVASDEVSLIRQRFEEIFISAGIDKKHFSFTDPHITLFMKPGNGDIHNIRKPMIIPISHLFNKDIVFYFEGICMYLGQKVLYRIGNVGFDGTPADKFRIILQQAIDKKKKALPQYNWGNLFQNFELKKDAKFIKEILLKEGVEGLEKSLGYDHKKIELIMSILKG